MTIQGSDVAIDGDADDVTNMNILDGLDEEIDQGDRNRDLPVERKTDSGSSSDSQ